MSKSTVMGFAINIHITINGVNYKLTAGKSMTLNLLPGTYQISYKVWCRRKKQLQLILLPKKTT